MRAMVLSPHRDDAAFSCGLLLDGLLRSHCQISLVNICTVSRYAPYLGDGNAGTARVTDARRAEDAAFVRCLRAGNGASANSVSVTDLQWLDLPLRWSVEDSAALADAALRTHEVEALAEAFRSLPAADVVIAPRALGGHLDHRLVAQAATLAFPAASLLYYEDLPYACMGASAESGGPVAGAWLPSTGAAAGLKRACALCYPSQIAPELADSMERHGAAHGGRERFTGSAEALACLQTALQVRGAVS